MAITDKQPIGNRIFTFDALPNNVPAEGLQPGDFVLDSSTNYLYVVSSGHALVQVAAQGGGGTPSGTDTQIQFNDGDVFGGDAGLKWNKTNRTFTVGDTTFTNGDVNIGQFNFNSDLSTVSGSNHLGGLDVQGGTSTPLSGSFGTRNMALIEAFPKISGSTGGNITILDAGGNIRGDGSAATLATLYGLYISPFIGQGGTADIHALEQDMIFVANGGPGSRGTVDDLRNLHIGVAASGGTITRLYGIKIEDQTDGVTNYAIKTGRGLADFGDDVIVTSVTGRAGYNGDLGAVVADLTRAGQGGTYAGGAISSHITEDATESGSQASALILGTEVSGELANTGIQGEGVQLFTKTKGTANFTAASVALVGISNNVSHESTGTLTKLYGESINMSGAADAGAVDQFSALRIDAGFTAAFGNGYGVNIGDVHGGTVESAAVNIENQGAGATDYAIKTGTGLISLGDELKLAAATTDRASLNLAAGSDPTSPTDGDVWFDGTDLKIRINGETKTITVG